MAVQLVSDLVGNFEDRFCSDMAQIVAIRVMKPPNVYNWLNWHIRSEFKYCNIQNTCYLLLCYLLINLIQNIAMA